MNNDFQNAVDNLILGLGNKLSHKEEWGYRYIDEVINNLEQMRNSNDYYIYALPREFVQEFLTGQQLINQWDRKISIDKVHYVEKKNDYLLTISWVNHDKLWQMWLRTAIQDCRFISITNYNYEKYFTRLDNRRVDELIEFLQKKKERFYQRFEQSQKISNQVINQEVRKHKSEMVVSREAVRKAIRDIQQDSKVIADAWNSTLTREEQQILINWLAKNIYSMRLYVVQGSSWDKAISELYPENIYGKPRRTIPSESSKDSINGYISVNNIDGDVPYNILKKITHKQNSEDIIKYYGGSKYRINNYLLVLYLLNNYNKNGFKLGKTNLNKYIKL